MCDLSNPNVYSIFTLLLIKQIFNKNESSKVASESWTQLWPRIILRNFGYTVLSDVF